MAAARAWVAGLFSCPSFRQPRSIHRFKAKGKEERGGGARAVRHVGHDRVAVRDEQARDARAHVAHGDDADGRQGLGGGGGHWSGEAGERGRLRVAFLGQLERGGSIRGYDPAAWKLEYQMRFTIEDQKRRGSRRCGSRL